MTRCLFRVALAVLSWVTAVCCGLAWLGAAGPARAAEEGGAGPALDLNRGLAEGSYVSDQVCAGCHGAQHDLAAASHHHHAMAEATAAAVLGAFDGVTRQIGGRPVTFSERDGRYFVETVGPDGAPGEFEVLYTFGYHPLQQYMIAFPGGRLQVLDVAWDVAAGEWFQLAPELGARPGDWQHWTGGFYRWNTTCADCHSTNLQKGYDPATDSFATTWSAINVGCQACHGPGGAHVAWAESGDPDATEMTPAQLGLLDLGEGASQIAMCGQCHSRRQRIAPPGSAAAGDSFELLDEFVPSLLRPDLYHADGQILDEVFVLGSFVQSPMYAAGVVCTDCHDPHSGGLLAEGNAVCTQCHNEFPPERFPEMVAKVYDSPDHHHHPEGSDGALCVNCHMPAQTYMEVDPRRDHSLRVPRPDLSVALGVPNACTQCHVDQSDDWALAAVTQWHGEPAWGPHFAEALYAAQMGLPSAPADLVAMITDPAQPAIARATGLSLLPDYLSPGASAAYQAGLTDPDPLVRLNAVAALEPFPMAQRWQAAASLLADPVRAVRLEAGRILAAAPRDSLTADERRRLDEAVADYIAAQELSQDMPEANMNLGNLYASIGEPAKAEAAYRLALRQRPDFVPAIINLAGLYQTQGRGAEEAAVLETWVERLPDSADLWHALGLLEVRRQNDTQALAALKRAAELDEANGRFGYVYGVALNSYGRWSEALKALQRVHEAAPGNREVLYAMATIARDRGRSEEALGHARALLALDPDDPQARQLVQQLEREN